MAFIELFVCKHTLIHTQSNREKECTNVEERKTRKAKIYKRVRKIKAMW